MGTPPPCGFLLTNNAVLLHCPDNGCSLPLENQTFIDKTKYLLTNLQMIQCIGQYLDAAFLRELQLLSALHFFL